MKDHKKFPKINKQVLGQLPSFSLGLLLGLFLFWFSLEEPFVFDLHPWKQPTHLEGTPIPLTAPIIQHKGYTVAYDGKTRNASWVYHRLTSNELIKTAERKECTFQEDPLLPEPIRSSLKDYERSGFDRGHLTPAANHTSSLETLQESFYLSNIVPQMPEFNRGYWRHVENHVRSLLNTFSTLHIFTGPLYLSHKARDGKRYVKYRVIGENEVAVPTHFFALIFADRNSQLFANGYILPNKAIPPDTPLKKFSTSVEEIQRVSGIVFKQLMQAN